MKINIKLKRILPIIPICILFCLCVALNKFVYIKILFLNPCRLQYDEYKTEFNEFSEYLIDDYRDNKYDFNYQIDTDGNRFYRVSYGNMEKTYITFPGEQQYNAEQIFYKSSQHFEIYYINVSKNSFTYITKEGYLLVYSLYGKPTHSDDRRLIKIERNWYLEEPKY